MTLVRVITFGQLTNEIARDLRDGDSILNPDALIRLIVVPEGTIFSELFQLTTVEGDVVELLCQESTPAEYDPIWDELG